MPFLQSVRNPPCRPPRGNRPLINEGKGVNPLHPLSSPIRNFYNKKTLIRLKKKKTPRYCGMIMWETHAVRAEGGFPTSSWRQ